MEPDKKVSFGFNKLSKKPALISKVFKKQDKIQLIDCLESHTIKLKNVVAEKPKGPLVISLPEGTTNILDQRRELKIKRDLKKEVVDDKPDSELTADELAARELIKEAQNAKFSNDSKNIYSLPISTENIVSIEGKAEPTIDDYESVPINEYGMAMLRGMGWKEGIAIGKNTKLAAATKEPTLRPRGMGLGADKLAPKQDKPVIDKNGEELILKKGAFAKITEGKQKGYYCEVQGFDDDESSRVIVKTAIHGLVLSVNQLYVVPVTRKEFAKSSKVLNSTKYEEYKSKGEYTGFQSTEAKLKPKKEKDSSSGDERHQNKKNHGPSPSPYKEAYKHKRRSRSPRPSNYKDKNSKEEDNKRHDSSHSDSDQESRKERSRSQSLKEKQSKHSSKAQHRSRSSSASSEKCKPKEKDSKRSASRKQEKNDRLRPKYKSSSDSDKSKDRCRSHREESKSKKTHSRHRYRSSDSESHSDKEQSKHKKKKTHRHRSSIDSEEDKRKYKKQHHGKSHGKDRSSSNSDSENEHKYKEGSRKPQPDEKSAKSKRKHKKSSKNKREKKDSGSDSTYSKDKKHKKHSRRSR